MLEPRSASARKNPHDRGLRPPTIESSLNNAPATHQRRVSEIPVPVGVANFGTPSYTIASQAGVRWFLGTGCRGAI